MGIGCAALAGMLSTSVTRLPGRLQRVIKGVGALLCTDWTHHKSTKSRFQIKCFSLEKYEKYYGEPQSPVTAHCYENQKYKRVSALGERYEKILNSINHLLGYST
uniref:Uncharacterized protein n=1 Tax=Peromyscus maniculatus bairdii TaxID=230844 RepID=A0A8C8UJW3_PERMB